MAKKVLTVLKINLPAGGATPAPPVGTALGPHGVNIMDFVKAYNDATADKRGQVIPAVITIYDDRSFEFITKLPPVSEMIKKKLGIQKGAGKPPFETAGTLNQAQLEEIANEKMQDLNTQDVQAAKKIVAGSARSMGVKVQE